MQPLRSDSRPVPGAAAGTRGGGDESYQEIFEGLARYTGDPFIAEVARALPKLAPAGLANALNKNQLLSKKWLVDELYRALGDRYATVRILAGWYGVLAAMLLNDPRFHIGRVVSVDLDPGCGAVAETLNARAVAAGRFEAVTGDVHRLDYAHDAWSTAAREPRNGSRPGPDLLINTSCEHLSRFHEWYARVPAGTPQALQSNDYYDCAEHVNCVPDLTAFKRQTPMSQVLYEGTLPLKRYTRFMLIGIK